MRARPGYLRGAIALLLFGLLVLLGLGLWGLAHLLTHLDHRLVAQAVLARSPAVDDGARAASLLGRSAVLIPATIILAVGLWWRLGRRATAPLLAVLGADAVQHVLKALVNRPRPTVSHLEHVTGSSFPSGHGTESAAAVMALVLLVRGRPPTQRGPITGVLILVALAVASSRVLLGVHYPTDVVAGMVLGALWAAVAVWSVSTPGPGIARGGTAMARHGDGDGGTRPRTGT